MRLLETVEGCEVTVQDDNSVTWTAKARIDSDGSGGNIGKDPFYQPETTLKVNGVSINPWKVPGIVVTPEIRNGVPGIVIGCQAFVFYKGKEEPAVVHDVGPHSRLGEMTPFLAERFNIPDSPVDGGDDNNDVSYRILPGVPAVIGDVTYPLVSSGTS